MKVEQTPIDQIIPYASNSRTHNDEQISQIAASIKEFGFNNPVLLDGDKGIIAGHGRVMAAKKLGLKAVPTIELKHLSENQRKAYIIADNKLALNAGWDMEMLTLEMGGLKDEGFDLSLIGFDDAELELDALFDGLPTEGANETKGKLSDRFGIAPFSVLNAREGWWQDRKRAWLSIGIQSEVARTVEGRNVSSGKNSAMHSLTGRLANEDAAKEGGATVSIFDPVLCELAYRWFCPKGGVVIDPFAGGSVRGIISGKLGREYVGYELRQEQVDANRVQADEICQELTPAWVCADSLTIDKMDTQADMLFTCPPYADLEVYSDDPKDLSTMPYDRFIETYSEIIRKTCGQLKADRFAVVVVGEVRNKKGGYYNFVGDTVTAFKNAGLTYYNEMILVTAVGSLPLRAGRTFDAGRKIGKTHQNVLVFVKGDAKKATQAIGKVEFGEIDGGEEAA